MQLSPKKIVIFADYFHPAYKGGGIIQSLKNLFDNFGAGEQFIVIASDKDLGGEKITHSQIEPGVHHIPVRNIWKQLRGMGWNSIGHVYFNGIYSPFFFLIPLIYLKVFRSGVKIVIAPRGMLQSGALEIRSGKKKLYLGILKRLGLFQNVIWHATDDTEKFDIEKFVPQTTEVFIAPNIPKKPLDLYMPIEKMTNGTLRLVFLSLITEKKNLHLILETLAIAKANIQFDIYGPVKDNDYWGLCQKLIMQLPVNVQCAYLGAVEPHKTQNIFSQYHAFVLPSKGENFGHAIYECFSAGRPAIIGYNTPWGDLSIKNAGYSVELNIESLDYAFNELLRMDQANFNLSCLHSIQWATENYSKSVGVEPYAKLFPGFGANA